MTKAFDDEEITHESFAMMGFTRVTSNVGATMHGSDLKHNTFIRMDLRHSSMRRGLNHNWYHGDKIIASVEMSQNQFAELITSMNLGDGIPVTLKRTERDGELADPEYTNVVEQHQREFKGKTDSIATGGDALITKMKSIFSKTGTIKKADKEQLLKDLEFVVQDIQANLPYVEDCFRETMDKVVTDAKGTIEAYYTHRIIETGIKALDDANKDFKAPVLLANDNGND